MDKKKEYANVLLSAYNNNEYNRRILKEQRR